MVERVIIKCDEILFGWQRTSAWRYFSGIVHSIIMDAFADLFIMCCIVVNTLFMAMDHAGISEEMLRFLTVGNYVRII